MAAQMDMGRRVSECVRIGMQHAELDALEREAARVQHQTNALDVVEAQVRAAAAERAAAEKNAEARRWEAVSPKAAGTKALPTLMTHPQTAKFEKVEAARVGAGADEYQNNLYADVHISDVEVGASEVKEEGAAVRSRSIQITIDLDEVRPWLRLLIYSAALVLFVFSVMCMFNVFFLFRMPSLYALMVFNMFCASVIIVVEGKALWYKRFGDAQTRVFRLLPFMASRPGRAFFYIFVGTFNTCFFGWTWVFALCGSLLNMCGFLILLTWVCETW